MNACMRSSSARRSGPTTERRQAAVADLVEQARAGRTASGSRSSPRGSTLERRRAARAPSPARCARSHGTPPNCSACVISCSATQRSSCSGSASSARAAWPRLGATNSSRAGAVGVEHRELVLAEHAPGEEARDRAGLDREHGARGRADAPPAGPMPPASRLATRARARSRSELQVGLDPALAVDRLGARAAASSGSRPV